MKNTIKTMDISSLLNIDLDSLNDSNLILMGDRFSMYNTILIFLKFTKVFSYFQNQIFG